MDGSLQLEDIYVLEMAGGGSSGSDAFFGAGAVPVGGGGVEVGSVGGGASDVQGDVGIAVVVDCCTDGSDDVATTTLINKAAAAAEEAAANTNALVNSYRQWQQQQTHQQQQQGQLSKQLPQQHAPHSNTIWISSGSEDEAQCQSKLASNWHGDIPGNNNDEHDNSNDGNDSIDNSQNLAASSKTDNNDSSDASSSSSSSSSSRSDSSSGSNSKGSKSRKEEFEQLIDFRVISWNAEGFQKDHAGLKDLLDSLTMVGKGWDAVLIQEGPTAANESTEEVEGGHLWHVAPACDRPRNVAILINARWNGSDIGLEFGHAGGRVAYADLAVHNHKLRLITAHLPHSGKPQSEFTATLCLLEDVVKSAKRDSRSIVIGVDANAVAGTRLDTDSTVVLGNFGYGERNDRGVSFVGWLHLNSLTATNTLYDKPSSRRWTHTLHSTGEQRQIDFILVSRDLRPAMRNVDICEECCYGSDHRALKLNLHITTSKPKKKQTKPKLQIRWKPQLDENDVPLFNAKMEQFLQTEQANDASTITTAIVDIATSTAQQLPTCKSKRDPVIRELFTARGSSSDPEERKALTLLLWKTLRAERRRKHNEGLDNLLNAGRGADLAKLLAKPIKAKRVTAVRDPRGRRLTQRTDIAEVFVKFYENLYYAVGDHTPTGRESGIEQVSADEVRTAISKLKGGKTGSDDGLVAEMLKTGCEPLVDKIAQLFTDILKNGVSIPEQWCRSKLVVLFKKGDTELPKNYRPVAIMPVLGKLFSGVLLNRLKPTLNAKQPPEQAGFRADYSCSDVVHTLRVMSEKATEWGLPLWMASLDLEKAFDTVLHSSVFDCLEDAGVESDLVNVIWKLYSQQEARVHVDKNTASKCLTSFEV